LLKGALLGSLQWLAAHQEEINNLNVFPVPDGDTGTNMMLTLQSAVEDIRDSPATEVGKIAKVAAHGSLMGARGNSGVILSQIFRGFANAVQGKSVVGPVDLGLAFEEAANFAYRAVNKPTEGTILTVAREAGRAAVAAGREPKATRVDVMKAAARAAREAVERTPTQLRILREAGVVDAGGYGLQVMLEGMLQSVRDSGQVMARTLPKPGSAAQAVLDLPEEGWGYCTEFLIKGENLDVEQIRAEIAAMGNSVLVVGDPELVKVHVHTDDPTKVIAAASSRGALERLSVGDMSTQHKRIREQNGRPRPEAAGAGNGAGPAPRRTNGLGMVVVVAGGGLAEIFRSLGADEVVEGGQTMNPSTEDMLKAVERVDYDEVLLLPNNKNVVLAASQVKDLTGKRVHLVETTTVPQGITAAVAFNPERGAEENAAVMREAAANVQTIEITTAVRDTRHNGKEVRKGDVISLVNGEIAETGDSYSSVIEASIEGLNLDDYELITIYQGAEVQEKEAEALRESLSQRYPDVEVELLAGGQEHYPYILSVD
jgi:hypothetical protein